MHDTANHMSIPGPSVTSPHFPHHLDPHDKPALRFINPSIPRLMSLVTKHAAPVSVPPSLAPSPPLLADIETHAADIVPCRWPDLDALA